MIKRKINTSIVLTIDIVLLILSIFTYRYIFSVENLKKSYAEETLEFIENNENPVFKVGQIVLYSSANAIDNSEDQSLKDMSICQYTDISIYIDKEYNSKLTKILKSAYTQKRKTIYNNLKELFNDKTNDVLSACELDPKLRAEQLEVEESKLSS